MATKTDETPKPRYNHIRMMLRVSRTEEATGFSLVSPKIGRTQAEKFVKDFIGLCELHGLDILGSIVAEGMMNDGTIRLNDDLFRSSTGGVMVDKGVDKGAGEAISSTLPLETTHAHDGLPTHTHPGRVEELAERPWGGQD